MGLDMYLERIYGLENLEEIIKDNGTTNVISPVDLSDYEDDYEVERVAYWRKANQIHAYFEDKLSDGELENCAYYEVKREDLEELLELCEEVLELGKRVNYDGTALHKIDALLPTRDGFFFGSTEYDEYYFYDLEDTIKMITPIVEKMKEYPKTRVWYSAWW